MISPLICNGQSMIAASPGAACLEPALHKQLLGHYPRDLTHRQSATLAAHTAMENEMPEMPPLPLHEPHGLQR